MGEWQPPWTCFCHVSLEFHPQSRRHPGHPSSRRGPGLATVKDAQLHLAGNSSLWRYNLHLLWTWGNHMKSDLADTTGGCMCGRRGGWRLHSSQIILGVAEVRRAAPPVHGFPLQQGLQAAAVHGPQRLALQTQLQVCYNSRRANGMKWLELVRLFQHGLIWCYVKHCVCHQVLVLWTAPLTLWVYLWPFSCFTRSTTCFERWEGQTRVLRRMRTPLLPPAAGWVSIELPWSHTWAGEKSENPKSTLLL